MERQSTTERNQTRNINIIQLAHWLANATANNNKGFILKPNDLRMLYLFVLWDYLSKRHSKKLDDPTNLTDQVPPIENDEQITIPEEDLIRMVQLLFHNTYYPYFNRVYNM